ncbi:RHS repeat protein [bacterium]|nr:RHS repeat protein [bacterium]
MKQTITIVLSVLLVLFSQSAHGSRSLQRLPVELIQSLITEYDYDESGNLVEEIQLGDAFDDLTTLRYTYDEQDRLETVLHNGKILKRYTYDPNDQVETITDALELATGYEYDELGRCTKTSYPDESVREQTYDAEGNLSREKTPLGVEYNYEYAAANRLDTVWRCGLIVVFIGQKDTIVDALMESFGVVMPFEALLKAVRGICG